MELKALQAYISGHCLTHAEIRNLSFVQNNIASINAIAQGAKMWEADELQDFKTSFFENMSTIPSTNQMTELIFKILTQVSGVHGRGENDKSLYVSILSTKERAKKVAHR
jgi:hypothetical protein